MFRKITVVVLLALAAINTAFPQAVAIDTALSNAAKEISESVPKGTKIAVLNISSDYAKLSDYIIDELIANLVSKRLFQVVPRSTVELELAKGELDFQYTGDVSDESQKRLGQFLGAGTIISGSVTKDTANSYRIVVSAIDLENFIYQSSYRISFKNDDQVKALIAGSGGVLDEDYTLEQRVGMGAFNILGGAGSIMNGHKSGWLTTGLELGGIAMVVLGSVVETPGYLIAGGISIGTGALFGLIIPFFHHKPGNARAAQNNFPFNLELVSSNNQEINGVRILYTMKF
jgi:TolB-like protein